MMPLQGLEVAMTSTQSKMKTLTDTQLVLLSAASQREDRGVVRSEAMDARLFTRATKALLKAGLIAERAKDRKAPGGAGPDGEAKMLVITAEGFNAIGVEEPEPAQPALRKPRERFRKTSSRRTSDTATRPLLADASSTTRPTTKRALIIAMLSRREGATLDDLVAATGWLPHTTRAALTGLRQRGLCLVRSKPEGEPAVYRIRDTADQGQAA
jgi:DNA-binding MarR family transcriptional regulator